MVTTTEATRSTPVAERTSALAADQRLRRLRWLGRTMDTRFTLPGTQIRLGWDSLLGLLPGVGDLLTGGVSAYIVYQAIQMGAPKRTIARMAANVLVDVLAGSVPLVGDLFDVAWKSNTRNVRLLEKWLDSKCPMDRPRNCGG